MTTFTPIPNSDIDQDSPVTQTLMDLLRGNMLAIQEGDPTAPNLLVGVAARSTFGALGTYVYAYCTTGDIGEGGTVSGANLRATSAARVVGINDGGSGFNETETLDAGTALSGTWRCMGQFDSSGSGSSRITLAGATNWIRIA